MADNSRERKINYILSRIKNTRAEKLVKEVIVAQAAFVMKTSERVIREIVSMLETAGEIDKRIWK